MAVECISLKHLNRFVGSKDKMPSVGTQSIPVDRLFLRDPSNVSQYTFGTPNSLIKFCMSNENSPGIHANINYVI